MTMLLIEGDERPAPGARAEGERLWIPAAELEAATGWALEPEGLCREGMCVPLPEGNDTNFVRDNLVDVAAVWRHLGKPVLHDTAGAVWSLGESAEDRMASLGSLEAPEFALPDAAGRLHRLSDYRGRKVLLVSWASW